MSGKVIDWIVLSAALAWLGMAVASAKPWAEPRPRAKCECPCGAPQVSDGERAKIKAYMEGK